MKKKGEEGGSTIKSRGYLAYFEVEDGWKDQKGRAGGVMNWKSTC